MLGNACSCRHCNELSRFKHLQTTEDRLFSTCGVLHGDSQRKVARIATESIQQCHPRCSSLFLRLQKLGFTPDKLGIILMARGLAWSLAGHQRPMCFL